jgi:hypothetical protein
MKNVVRDGRSAGCWNAGVVADGSQYSSSQSVGMSTSKLRRVSDGPNPDDHSALLFVLNDARPAHCRGTRSIKRNKHPG